MRETRNSIYLENQNLRINELRLKRKIEELEAKVNDLKEAINYTHSCKSDSELLQKLEMIKNFKWGIDARDNERRMCELIQLL